MKEPDYEKYSLSDLHEALERIDRTKWPDRVEKIESLLNDPIRSEKLRVQQIQKDTLDRSERQRNLMSTYDMFVLLSGVIGGFTGSFIGRHGIIQIDSGLGRIFMGLGCACVGMLIVSSALKSK